MTTVAVLLVSGAKRLARSSSPRLDAEVLMTRLTGLSRAQFYAHPELELPAPVAAAYDTLIDARERGMPVAYLTGEREFWSRNFKVTPDTLIPRADTETLIAAALQLKLPERARVLDMGTGSGAIAITLALECPAWDVAASDVSDAALIVARDNAARLGACVRFCSGSWFAALPAADHFDLIVSNPPYIAADDAHLVTGDVRFEPRRALVAAEDGLADLAALLRDAPQYMAPGAWLLLEHGRDQGDAVRAMAVAAGFSPTKTLQDIAGNARALLAGWQHSSNPEQAHHA